MSYKIELKVAKEAAQNAAEIIHSFSLKKDVNVQQKGKNDLLTDADIAAEKSIIATILSHFPKDQILAEESSPNIDSFKGRVWIIDPIDGTTNFSHNFGIYCVSIALWIDGVAKVGVVLNVPSKELFYAFEGGGSYLNDERIWVSDTEDLSSSLIFTGFPYATFEFIDSYLNLLKSLMQKTHGIRRPGAASYDLCMVACGRADGFFEYGLSAWDVAAAALLIQEAGGVVTDWKNSNDYLFGKRIVTGNHFIQQKLLQEIQNLFPSEELSQ